MHPHQVVGVVLAAGVGRRFGGFKALVPINGVRMVDRAVGVLAAAGVSDRIVVAHPGWPSGAVDSVEATVSVNHGWAEGMGSSLRIALAHPLLPGHQGVVVLLADQPCISPGCVRAVLEAADDATAAVQAAYQGRRGHPVLLGAAHWAGVSAVARGDAGARRYLETRSAQLRVVDCTGLGDDVDVDEPADLEALESAPPR